MARLRLPAILLAASLSAGCASGLRYAGARAADLGDLVTVGGESCWMPFFPVNLGVRATDVLHVGLGFQGGMGVDGPEPLPRGIGWTRFRTIGIYSVTEMNLGLDCRRVLAAGRVRGRTYRDGLYAEDRCTLFAHALTGERRGVRSFADFLDLEGSIGVGLGVRISIRPGEIADFLAGLATFDLSGDDDGIKPPAETEPLPEEPAPAPPPPPAEAPKP